MAVLGAAGGIGQPLSLLLKQSPLISKLALYDIRNAEGVAVDLSHINTETQVTGYGSNNIAEALKGADVVVIPAGIQRFPITNRNDMFKDNAGMIRVLIEAIAMNCPNALIAIISNPVNSLVPLAAEVLKKHNVFDPNRLFGVSTLDVVRACTFGAQAKGRCPTTVHVPVIGGHDGLTIIALFSQSKPPLDLNDDQVKALVKRVQTAAFEVVDAKDKAGSATLSMASAAARFTISVCIESCSIKSVLRITHFFPLARQRSTGCARHH